MIPILQTRRLRQVVYLGHTVSGQWDAKLDVLSSSPVLLTLC